MKKFPLLLLLLCTMGATAQKDWNSGQILHALKKLQNPTRVLYLAAHPDDENTRMIAWLDNGAGARTAYLSLTRGDGGQNLIGTELGNKLGVLRSQELIQARKIDGGEQFFTRAIDFGYSKTADETMQKWGETEVLADVVWVIRQFRPDVIITRFPPDARGGHGHHTASAMLGMDAFNQAGDPKAFPEQLNYVETWQPKRIYWNSSVWWNRNLDSIAQNNPDYVIVDVGGYNALLGQSYNEIASYSRTQHKSQGFGVSVARGSSNEYLQYLAGDKASGDIFEGINQSWSRYNFKTGDKKLQAIINDFDPAKPAASLPALRDLKEAASAINDPSQRAYLQKEIDNIIIASLGWHAEVLSPKAFITPGTPVELSLEVINRSDISAQLKSIEYHGKKVDIDTALPSNEMLTKTFEIVVSDAISQPYWLHNPGEALFAIREQELIGKPEHEPVPEVTLHFSVKDEKYAIAIPVTHKYSDRVEGEIIEPVFVVPQVVVNPNQENMIFVENAPQTLLLEVRTFNGVEKNLQIQAPNWRVEPSQINIEGNGEEQVHQIPVKIWPTARSGEDMLRISIAGEGQALNLTEIRYDHIDDRLVMEPATVNLISIDLKKEGERIGYIPGAGDKVAEAIELMGYKVDILGEDDVQHTDLSKYKAIVAGIRAYNTQEWLPAAKEKLMEYVGDGGNYIVQYNTSSRDLLSDNIGPYPFVISRERVTEEDAEVQFVFPDNPVFNVPNKITQADFEGWVQERGLYFASEWDPRYEAPIGWHDEGEPMRGGGLLVGRYGKGAFIYTGISFFRELPAGVPGAYRLLANILSYPNGETDGE